MIQCVELPNRAFIAVSGADRTDFLQGLITQDMRLLGPERPLLYGALLTPQGKYLYDFFLWHENDAVLLETDAAKRDELLQVLCKYKLRKKVKLSAEEGPVYQIFGAGAGQGVPDPRHPELGWRARAKPDLPEAPLDLWTTHRLRFNVPDCLQDLRIGLSTPFEGNIDLLNGISFDKGCYLGQELVSRIHHRGLVKRRFPDL